MKYSYYPGCTLKNKAKDLDAYARASAKALGFEMEEIKDWQCCGGVYPLGSDEIATKLSSVRALNDAKEKGQDLITVCSACHHVLKRVNDDMKEPVIYPYRNECCGGYISLKEKDMAQNMCEKIMDSAKGFEADMLITACPLCMYNLKKNGNGDLPVYYFTELLAEALGVKEEVAK